MLKDYCLKPIFQCQMLLHYADMNPVIILGMFSRKQKVFPLSNSGKQRDILHKKGLTLKMR